MYRAEWCEDIVVLAMKTIIAVMIRMCGGPDDSVSSSRECLLGRQELRRQEKPINFSNNV